MHRKFIDDIFARCLVIMKNVVISYIKGYSGPTLRPSCDVIDDVIIMKILFIGIIWDDLFISEVKLKLCLIFQNFQNGHYFELATNFFTGSYTGRRIYQKDSHDHFRHFELLIDAVIQILTEIYQFQNVTYFVTWWRHQWIMNMYSYNCSHNLMIHMHRKFNDDIFARCLVIMKNVIISFTKEYRGPTLRPPCDVIDDVIIMKILFIDIIWDDLFISEVKLKLCLPEVEYTRKIAMSISDILSFWSTL